MKIFVPITFYIFGLNIFYVWGVLNDGWKEWFYFWDKGKDLLLFIALYQLVDRKYKWAIKSVIIFSSIRFLWQIISSFTGLNINNSIAVGILFISLSFVCSYLIIKEFLKWLK